MGSINKVVAILVIWAVIVTVWMVVLSTSGSWSNCRENGARSDAESPELASLYNSRRGPEPEQVQETRLPTETVSPSEAATSSEGTVLHEKLLGYFSRIMRRPPPADLELEEGASLEENCTVVLLTYKRSTTLSKVISHYCKVPFIQKILVVWNDVNETIPLTVKSWQDRCGVKFILPDANQPINRYLPWKEIETDCKPNYRLWCSIARPSMRGTSSLLYTKDTSNIPNNFRNT